MALKLDKAKIEESYGNLEKACNGSVGECFDRLAAVLIPHQGENALMDELLSNCKAAQDQYNSQYLPALKATMDSFTATYDIAEYLEKKASVGELSKQDVSASMQTVDASAVVM